MLGPAVAAVAAVAAVTVVVVVVVVVVIVVVVVVVAVAVAVTVAVAARSRPPPRFAFLSTSSCRAWWWRLSRSKAHSSLCKERPVDSIHEIPDRLTAEIKILHGSQYNIARKTAEEEKKRTYLFAKVTLSSVMAVLLSAWIAPPW